MKTLKLALERTQNNRKLKIILHAQEIKCELGKFLQIRTNKSVAKFLQIEFSMNYCVVLNYWVKMIIQIYYFTCVSC